MTAVAEQRAASDYDLSPRTANIAITVLIVGYALLMGAAAVYKYAHFGYGYDQVDFEQAVWATTQGRAFFDSRFNFTDVVFGMDFMPALGAWLPFYAIFPSPHTMNLLQTAIMALGALPVYWLGRDVLGWRLAGLAFAAVYLLYPTIEYVNLFPDYMRPLAVTLLLFAIYFLHRRLLLPTLIFAALALLTRTDVALTMAMLGVYALFAPTLTLPRNGEGETDAPHPTLSPKGRGEADGTHPALSPKGRGEAEDAPHPALSPKGRGEAEDAPTALSSSLTQHSALSTQHSALSFAVPLLVGGLLYFFLSVYLIVPSFTYSCVNSAGTNIIGGQVTPTPTLPRNGGGSNVASGAAEPGSSGCGEGSNFLIGYYSHLGGATSFGDVIKYVVTHPIEVAQLVFTPQKLWYVLLMLLPGALLVLLYPPAWLLLLPTFALNLLTNREAQLNSQSHYQMLLIPGLIVGAIFGLRRVLRWEGMRYEVRGMSVATQDGDAATNSKLKTRNSKLLLALPVAAALIVNLALGNPALSAFRYGESDARVKAANTLIAMIPANAGVAATSSLGPHLLPRMYLYNFPPAAYTPYEKDYRFPTNSKVANSDQLEYIITDENARVLQDGPGLAAFTALRNDPHWQVVAEREGFILFKQR